jgi:hypothetical protein
VRAVPDNELRYYELAGLRALEDAAKAQRAKLTLALARIRREIKRREALDAKRVQG